MRDLSRDHSLMSLNTATVRQQGSLVDIVEACARHGIRAIDPWREQVAAVGLDRAVKAVRDAGLALSGYCRGGMFTADEAHRVGGARRQPARDRRGQGAGRALRRAGGRRPAAIFAARQRREQGSGRRPGPGCRRHQRDDGLCVVGGHEARHRAAAPHVCRRPRLREHAAPRARSLRPARPRPQRHARRRARRLPHVVGLRADDADRALRRRSACSLSTSATGWCRPPTCSTTAA